VGRCSSPPSTTTPKELVGAYDIRTPSVSTTAGSLSGGNQQKVVVAREFDRPIDLLVASQPTRGVDVGSIEYIHAQLVAKRDEAPPCCWCPRSSTRCWRWPTGWP
jgi:ABC-type uncharacterized transport system ATPase subunit